jgi:hypothetical protein
LERLLARSGLQRDFWKSRDHLKRLEGMVYLSNQTLEAQLAVAFARAEPDTVALYLAASEESLSGKKNRLGREELLGTLPAYAVIREWMGRDRETVTAERRVERLEKLLLMAINELRKGELSAAADNVEHEMRRRVR